MQRRTSLWDRCWCKKKRFCSCPAWPGEWWTPLWKTISFSCSHLGSYRDREGRAFLSQLSCELLSCRGPVMLLSSFWHAQYKKPPLSYLGRWGRLPSALILYSSIIAMNLERQSFSHSSVLFHIQMSISTSSTPIFLHLCQRKHHVPCVLARKPFPMITCLWTCCFLPTLQQSNTGPFLASRCHISLFWTLKMISSSLEVWVFQCVYESFQEQIRSLASTLVLVKLWRKAQVHGFTCLSKFMKLCSLQTSTLNSYLLL